MLLDLDSGLPTIHMRFGNSDTNVANCFTHVDSFAGMNVGNLKLHQWIIITNTYISERYIKFYDETPFDPILLN